MSSREKKLLTFFAVAGFLVLNFLAIGFYNTKRLEVERKHDAAQRDLNTAMLFRSSREQVLDEMDWLAKHEPKPAANQDVQVELESFCKEEAGTVGLSIKNLKLLSSDTTKDHYFHCAKIQLTVNGTEESLYRWLDRLNVPDQLRIASNIRLSPNKEDDTKIDCTAIIEQWFVPVPPSA